MSLLPVLFDWDDLCVCPSRCRRHRYQNPFDDFALGIPQDWLALPSEMRQLQRRELGRELRDIAPTIGKEGFQVNLDVQQFNPNEITVKTAENSIVIEGKHEERSDEHGYISRQFTRRYTLPKGYDANSVTSSLSSDGVLTIKAPPPKELESGERVIPIQQTGPARLSVKENKKEKAEKKK